MTDKRSQIEAVATAAIKRGGLSSVSFRTLADAVGVKSASVHYHFPTKGDLAEAVVRNYTASFTQALQDLVTTEASLRARLHALVDIFETVAAEDELCLCGSVASEATGLNDGTRGALRTFFALAEETLESLVAQQSASLNTVLEPHDVAKLLMAGLEGAGLIDRAVNGREHLNAFRKLIDAITQPD